MFSPNGGVNMPIAILAVMTIPKWIGSTPTVFTSGMKSGVSTKIAEVGSRKQPTINRIILVAIRKDQDESCKVCNHATSACGKPLMLSIQENKAAVETITRICAVSMAERAAASSTSLHD